jgi:hypothetical protein
MTLEIHTEVGIGPVIATSAVGARFDIFPSAEVGASIDILLLLLFFEVGASFGFFAEAGAGFLAEAGASFGFFFAADASFDTLFLLFFF